MNDNNISEIDLLINTANNIENGNLNSVQEIQDVLHQLISKANQFIAEHNYKTALLLLQNAELIASRQPDQNISATIFKTRAGLYQEIGDYELSLENYFSLLAILQTLKRHSEMLEVYHNIGDIYISKQLPKSCIENFEKALKLAIDSKDESEIIKSHALLGNAFNWADHLDEAKLHLEKSYNLLSDKISVKIKTITTGSLAILYRKLKEFDKAIKYFNEALSFTKSGGEIRYYVSMLNGLAKLYIENQDPVHALELLNEALQLCEANHHQLPKIIERNTFEYLGSAYEQNSEFEKALHFFKKSKELEKEISDTESNLRLQGLQIKYDVDEAEKEKEIMRISSKQKELFLANMSHEIRTPMNAVMGMTHLLLKTEITDKQKSYLDMIRQSTENLLVIINDILDLSKIESGKLDFEKRIFGLHEFTNLLLHTFQMKAEEKGIGFEIVFQKNIHDQLIGDPYRLNQVMINLISNAIKFTNKGKVQLIISSENETENDLDLIMSVTDTGIGISPDKMKSIFDSFSQADVTISRKYGGTGLGLTISKQLIEMQGGKILVESKFGSGSSFTTKLKFGKSFFVVNNKSSQSFHLKDYKFLLVEDHPFNQIVARETLLEEMPGATVDIAENATVAFDLLNTKMYDLILMDLHLPEMDGFEITRIIRTQYPKPICDLPIIALTANVNSDQIKKCFNVGMNDFLGKPFMPEDLFTVISRVMY